ncbi:MAG: signal peptidase I [Bacteroidaceae bacterium]|nr:signal peptidase I [Bacteroidaceae bacterium]
MIGLLCIFCNICVMSSFKVPSHSMYPTLLSGDYIIVNKALLGARVFNPLDLVEGKEPKIHRLPALKNVKRGDVLVFNNPCAQYWDSITFSTRDYYVKRCIGLPGDTLEIRDAHYRIRGCNNLIGDWDEQEQLRLFLQTTQNTNHPIEGYYTIGEWNIGEFGPFYIPRAGDTLTLDYQATKCYQRCIEWELGCKLTCDKANEQFFQQGQPFCGYRFKNDYYFMAGDHVINSKDSRYWGVVPECYIVGKVTHVWKSIDPSSERLRYKRIMKRVR